MLKTTLSGLLAHKLRLALTGFAIVLGVAFVCATLILSNGLQTSFDRIFTTQGTHVAAVVRGHLQPGGENGGFADARHPVSSSLVTAVTKVSGVAAAEGVIFRPGVSLLDASGKPYASQGPPEFGTNWIQTKALSPYQLRSGNAPTQANQVVIDAATAKVRQLSTGQTAFFVVNGGSQEPFLVVGIAGYGTADNLNGASIAIFTVETTQRLFGQQGMFDRIDVASTGDVSDTELRDRIAASLPTSAEAATGATANGEQIQAIDSIFAIIRTILLVFALIALFVGSFLIVNTFSILIAQRTRELGLLRALGASRGQVFRSVLLEALITGLLAAAVGCGAGVLMAHGLYAAVSSSGGGLPPADLVLQFSTIAIGIGLGTVITVAAAVFPARKATRVAPVEALRDAADTAASMGLGRLVVGTLLTLGGGGLVGVGLFAGTSASLQLLGAGGFLLYIGVSLLAPLVVFPVVGTLGLPIAATRGAAGKLARTNAIRTPRRAASTAAALMIGVSLVTGIAVLTESQKASSAAAVQDSVRADYIVFGRGGGGGGGGIAASTTSALAHDPHFSTVTDVRTGVILVNGASTDGLALDPAVYQQVVTIDAASGDPAALAQPNTIFVDQQQASSHGWKVGDRISVNFPQSDRTVDETIGCIFNANALLSGYVFSTETYAANFPNPRSFAILVRAAPGVSHIDGLEALKSALKSYPTLTAYDKDAFLALTNSQLDQFTNIIDIFLFMAILIAALGITNTLALSVMERTREIGLLRAVGLSRRQTRTMIRWESVLIAFLGLVLGMVIGLALGIAAVRALASTGSFGHLAVPVVQLLIFAVGALVVGVAAGALPAFRAGRLNVLDAIAME